MRVKLFIKTGILAMLRLLLCSGAQPLYAQATDTTRVLPGDSITMIKQLLAEKFMQQPKHTKFIDQMNGANIEQLIPDSTALDSLSGVVLLQMRRLKSNMNQQGKALIGDGLRTSKDMVQQSIAGVLQTSEIKNLIKAFTGMAKQPLLQWKGGAVQIYGQNGATMGGAANGLMNNSSIASAWTVLNIPVTVRIMRQDFIGLQHYSGNTFSMQFNKEAYLNSLRQQLDQKVKLQELFSYDQLAKKIKDQVIRRLKPSLDSLDAVYKGQLGSAIKALNNPVDLLKMDEPTLRAKLQELLPSTKQLENAAGSVTQITGSSSRELLEKDSLLISLPYKENIGKVITVLDSFKTLLQPKDLLNQLQDSAAFRQEQIRQTLNDPGKLKAMVNDQLSLDGIQKLFLNISQLQMGLHTICLSPLSVNQYSNNGLSASFFNTKKFLFVMLGKQATLNGIFSNPSEQPALPVSNSAMGISLGKGNITTDHTHIGLFSYQYGKASGQNAFAGTIPGRTIVTTISNQFTIGESGKLMLELSRSSHSYTNQSLNDTMQASAGTGKQLVSNGNMFDQMALTLQFSGTSECTKLDYDMHLAKTGSAYSNPGNLFITSGSTEFGGALRKSVLQNRLQVAAKLNYHDYQFSSIGTKWVNYNFSFQAKWKMKKGQSLSVRYQPYFSTRIQKDSKYATANNRISLDGLFRKRFGNLNYHHAIALSFSQSNNLRDSISAHNGIDFSSMQTFTIGKRSWYVNLQYIKASSIPLVIFLNSQFNAEAGCMYNLCKGISGSTGIHYNTMKQWYRQTGIKQSLSGQISDRLIVTLYADLQKRLKTYAPYYSGSTSLNWSLQYIVK